MSSDSFSTVNPATGEKLEVHRHLTSDQVESQLQSAFQKYHEFKSKPTSVRREELRALASRLRESVQDLGRMITLEMGKPISDSTAEIEKCASACDYFAENLSRFSGVEDSSSPYKQARIYKESMGPILAIMPWNFPVWQVIRFAAPAVGIGNPILLKHADQVAGTAQKMAQIFDSVSPGLLFNFRVDHDQTARLIADKRVRGVTLTGSTAAGRQVAELAGRNLKKTVLELGGSDAYVILEDGDATRAGEICAKARMVNNGQSCIAAKRFVVERSQMNSFLQSFESTLGKLLPGNPLVKETAIGSLAAVKFQKQLLEQCRQLEKNGAQKIFDLESATAFNSAHPGAFFPARIYKVSSDQDFAFQEEFFGPVALVFEFETEKEALALCNRSPYGLGGAVFSQDLERAERFAHEMEAGFITINEQVKSDPRLPFGGVKDSGYGSELSLYGFQEFCNIKTLGFGG